MRACVCVWGVYGKQCSCQKCHVLNFLHYLDRSQTKYQIVLTKTDVVFPIDVARRAMQIEEVNIVEKW